MCILIQLHLLAWLLLLVFHSNMLFPNFDFFPVAMWKKAERDRKQRTQNWPMSSGSPVICFWMWSLSSTAPVSRDWRVTNCGGCWWMLHRVLPQNYWITDLTMYGHSLVSNKTDRISLTDCWLCQSRQLLFS